MRAGDKRVKEDQAGAALPRVAGVARYTPTGDGKLRLVLSLYGRLSRAYGAKGARPMRATSGQREDLAGAALPRVAGVARYTPTGE